MKFLISQDLLFEAINEAHKSIGHFRTEKTTAQVKKR
jgi:hypothetical protein